MRNMSFLQLSSPRRRLLRLFQQLNYGSLKVHVVDGEVYFDDSTELSINIHLDCERVGRPQLALEDFDLPIEARRLFARIDSLETAEIEILVHDGLPRRVVVTRPLVSEDGQQDATKEPR